MLTIFSFIICILLLRQNWLEKEKGCMYMCICNIYIFTMDMKKLTFFTGLCRWTNSTDYLGNSNSEFLMLAKTSIIKAWYLISVFIWAIILLQWRSRFDPQTFLIFKFVKFHCGTLYVMKKQTANCFRTRKTKKYSLSLVAIKQDRKISQ